MGRRARGWCQVLGIAVTIAALGLGCSSDAPEDPEVFCSALRSAGGVTQSVAPIDLDDSVSIAASIADLEDLASKAPEALGDDVQIVSDVYGEVLRAVAATAPGARADVLRDLQDRLDQAAQPAARLQAYGEDVCGIRFDGPAQPTPTPTPLDLDD